jgi:hypothetical protein
MIVCSLDRLGDVSHHYGGVSKGPAAAAGRGGWRQDVAVHTCGHSQYRAG